MLTKGIVAAVVALSIIAGPALAGNRNSAINQNAKMCRGKVAAKHVPASKQAG
jgi:hypothetical protein